MWLLFHLLQLMVGLALASDPYYEPGDRAESPPRPPLSQITGRHNTCGQAGLAGDYSGYITVKGGPKEEANFFFWFFEARRLPQAAPVIVYLNGGPGLSSIYRIFDGSGPCKFNHSGKVVSNPHSFNEYANILYVDQPVGTGFTFGTADLSVEKKAGDYLYKFIQQFIIEFPQYRENEYGIWTSDWGANVGLSLAVRIFEKEATLIGSETGPNGEVPIRFTMLGMESPKIDPPMQLGYMWMYMIQNPWIWFYEFDVGKKGLVEYKKKMEADLVACAQWKKKDCEKELKTYVQTIRQLTTPKGLRTEFDLWDVRDARHGSDRSRSIMMSKTLAARWLNDAKNQEHLGVTGGKLNRGPVKLEPWNIEVAEDFADQQENLITNHLGLRKLSQNVTVGDNGPFPLEPLAWHEVSFDPEHMHSRMLQIGEYVTVKDFNFVAIKAAGHVIAESRK
ncbi:hypothetical protein ACHAPT_002356 [Fusarium lateritium]